MPRVFHTPGVYREEIDLSEILVAAGISNGGIVISSPQGPINRPVLITNDKEFNDTFGKPIFTSGNNAGIQGLSSGFFPEWGYGSYASLEFLKESSVLYVVRQVNNGDTYGTVVAKGILSGTASGTWTNSATGIAASQLTEILDRSTRIQNVDSNAQAILGSAGGKLLVASLFPGSNGNNYAVTIEPFSSACDWVNAYDNYVAPSAADTPSLFPIASKVFKLNVYDNLGNDWTDYETLSGDVAAGKLRITPVETFYGTLTPAQDSDKNQLFIEDIVNGNSKYIYVKVLDGAASDAFGTIPNASTANRPVQTDTNGSFVYLNRLMQVANGVANKPTKAGFGDEATAWKIFENRENASVGILIAPTYNQTVKQEVARIAAKRADCICVLQTGDPTKETVQDVKDSESYGYSNPSYVALYCGWSKVYDQFNDRFFYMPNAVYGAMLMARVDNVGNPWDAPAGVNRATLQVFDQRRIWTFDEIGQLYDSNINSVRFIQGVGFAMWGQKTAQLKKSALDRIQVRRNLLYIENNCEIALVQFVFENNTTRTRQRVFSLLDPFLARVLASGGLYAYNLVVDDTNNTPDIIDANQMAVDIYVQPTKTAEFINMRTIITRTGISFEEVRIA